MKILLDDSTQFTAEIRPTNWEEKLFSGERAWLLFYDFFTKDKISGNISMKWILLQNMISKKRKNEKFKYLLFIYLSMGNKYIKLKEIEEPEEIKKHALQKVSSPEWKIMERESTIAMFSLSSIFLPKYLWKYWSEVLKENGISWQLFLRSMKTCKREVIDWIDGKISWEKLLQIIEDKINVLFGKK